MKSSVLFENVNERYIPVSELRSHSPEENRFEDSKWFSRENFKGKKMQTNGDESVNRMVGGDYNENAEMEL